MFAMNTELHKKYKLKKCIPYIFLMPAVILIAVFLFYPMGSVFYYSLFKYNLAKPYANGFYGLGNFIDILTKDKLFYKTLWVTVKWVFGTVSVQLIIGLLISNVLNQRMRFRGFFRAATFLPWAVSGIITSMLWSLIYNEHMGLLNTILLNLGIIKKGIAWTSSLDTVFGAIVVAEIWRGFPFFVIILLASLQNIPESIYESCRVDGAGRLSTFFYITLPHLKQTIIFGTILRGVWEFNNIDVIYAITGGGPANMTTTLSMYMINQGIKANNFGYAAALTVIVSTILMILIYFYMKIMRYSEEGM
jgi:multiple sugar transport system permease protein